MYVRVKRKKATYFVQCEASAPAAELKERVRAAAGLATAAAAADDLRLIPAGAREPLADAKTLAEQNVENDAVLALVLRSPARRNPLARIPDARIGLPPDSKAWEAVDIQMYAESSGVSEVESS
eukprot:SM000289S10416  [mRNA]  locus=s289:29436:30223:- [translate_table: standard]